MRSDGLLCQMHGLGIATKITLTGIHGKCLFVVLTNTISRVPGRKESHTKNAASLKYGHLICITQKSRSNVMLSKRKYESNDSKTRPIIHILWRKVKSSSDQMPFEI